MGNNFGFMWTKFSFFRLADALMPEKQYFLVTIFRFVVPCQGFWQFLFRFQNPTKIDYKTDAYAKILFLLHLSLWWICWQCFIYQRKDNAMNFSFFTHMVRLVQTYFIWQEWQCLIPANIKKGMFLEPNLSSRRQRAICIIP